MIRRVSPRFSIDASYTFAFVMILLTVLIMLMASPIGHSHGWALELPRTHHASSMPHARREDAVTLAITRDGNVFFGHHQIRATELPNEIEEAIRNGAERKVYVRVDGRAKYMDVAPVLEALRATPVREVAFLTEQLQRLPAQ